MDADRGSTTSEGYKGTVLGFDFLDDMREDRLDEELEQKRSEGRKRKRDQEVSEQKEGGIYVCYSGLEVAREGSKRG